MASSSGQQKYQVFLSFRGEDTRNNFTSHIHWALERKGIYTFVDCQLKRGEEITQALFTAIEESTISIIILSKNYASSSWCLEELSKILECKESNGQMVVPIFYHVDPSHVRHQTGKSFEEAFAKHQERFKDRTDKVERWKAALKKVGNLSGYHIQNDRWESEHIMKIVEDISKELIYNSSNDFKGLVGIGSRVKKIESLLHFNLVDVRILGIWGMGGIGKTTIAEAIYHRNSAKFEGCCFLANGREKSEKGEIFDLRDEKNLNIGTSSLPLFIHNRFRHKKVLIILDNVNNSMRLDLFLKKDYFGPRSRIIVTSRDKQVLRPVIDKMYKVPGLNDDEALQLFSLFAFKQSQPKQDFMELSKKVVDYANGLPLALKVLSSNLYNRSKSFWECNLKKLKEIPNRGIDDILRISFDGLDHEEKNIFLDIACFFKGMDRDYVTNILDGHYISAMSGIEVLIDKSLVTTLHNMLEMHDLVQQMGWNIVGQESNEPGERSRLWTPKDVYHLLKHDTGTKKVEGIFLDMSKIREVRLRPEAFARMHNLKFLKFHSSDFKGERKVYISQEGLNSLPDNLSLLYWDDYPSKSLPLSFCPENLVELSMPNSNVERLWNGVQNLENLKRLNLSNSQQLIEIPDLSKATNLEGISLRGCTSLVELPSSILCLNNLCYLGLAHCDEMRINARNSHYRAYPYFDYCLNITKFPEIPRNITFLCLSGIAIKEVPSSIECLSRLRDLCLQDCRRLKRLPSNIFKLKSLRVLNLSGCLKLESFPQILETNKCLLRLWLDDTSIEELPSSIEHLVKLLSLHLNNCKKLKTLPSTIGKLQSLGNLSLIKCSNITKFPEIPTTLTSLDLSRTAIEQVPSSIECLPKFLKLERLNLSYCKRLHSLLELPPRLRSLYAHDCTSLEAVSCAFPISHHQHRFIFTNCKKLDQKAISAKTQLRIQQMATEDVKFHHNNKGKLRNSTLYICFPGSEIPEWFGYQNRGSSVATPLPPYLHDHKFVGFALCLVVAFENYLGLLYVNCRFNFKTNGVRSHRWCCLPLYNDRRFIDSDHVIVVYDFGLYREWDSGESNHHLSEASFEFSVSRYPNRPAYSDMVKMCGVCLLYAQDDLSVFPHPPSESDSGECNPLMIQPTSPYDPTQFSLNCGVNNPPSESESESEELMQVPSESESEELMQEPSESEREKLMQDPSESESESESESDFEELMQEDGVIIKRCCSDCCYDKAEPSFNPGRDAVMIQPSSPYDTTCLSLNCGVIDQGFGETMQEDGTTNKRSRNDQHNNEAEAEPSRNFNSEKVEEEHCFGCFGWMKMEVTGWSRNLLHR